MPLLLLFFFFFFFALHLHLHLHLHLSQPSARLVPVLALLCAVSGCSQLTQRACGKQAGAPPSAAPSAYPPPHPPKKAGMNQRPTSPSSETVACRCWGAAVGPRRLYPILKAPPGLNPCGASTGLRDTPHVCPLIGTPAAACLPGLMRASSSGDKSRQHDMKEGSSPRGRLVRAETAC